MPIPMYFDPDAPAQPSQYALEFGEFLALLDDTEPAAILEIGVFAGGALWQYVKRIAPGGVMVGIDLPGAAWGMRHVANPEAWVEWGRRRAVRVIPIMKDSHAESTMQIAHCFAPYDVIFIDGDHSYQGVKADFEQYKYMLRPGGMIALHDIVPHADPQMGVDRFWVELKKQYRWRELLSAPDQHDRGIGIIWL